MRIFKFIVSPFVVVAAVLATGCVPMGGTYGTSTYTVGQQQQQVMVGTGVFVNGQELSADDKAKLDWLLSYTVPAGNYYVTNDGFMGVVGQQASVNLIAYAKAKGVYQQGNGNTGSRGSSHYNGYSGDSITSDGNGCTIMSSGSMSFSSGC